MHLSATPQKFIQSFYRLSTRLHAITRYWCASKLDKTITLDSACFLLNYADGMYQAGLYV